MKTAIVTYLVSMMLLAPPSDDPTGGPSAGHMLPIIFVSLMFLCAFIAAVVLYRTDNQPNHTHVLPTILLTVASVFSIFAIVSLINGPSVMGDHPPTPDERNNEPHSFFGIHTHHAFGAWTIAIAGAICFVSGIWLLFKPEPHRWFTIVSFIAAAACFCVILTLLI